MSSGDSDQRGAASGRAFGACCSIGFDRPALSLGATGRSRSTTGCRAKGPTRPQRLAVSDRPDLPAPALRFAA